MWTIVLPVWISERLICHLLSSPRKLSPPSKRLIRNIEVVFFRVMKWPVHLDLDSWHTRASFMSVTAVSQRSSIQGKQQCGVRTGVHPRNGAPKVGLQPPSNGQTLPSLRSCLKAKETRGSDRPQEFSPSTEVNLLRWSTLLQDLTTPSGFLSLRNSSVIHVTGCHVSSRDLERQMLFAALSTLSRWLDRHTSCRLLSTYWEYD